MKLKKLILLGKLNWREGEERNRKEHFIELALRAASEMPPAELGEKNLKRALTLK
jgi:hypothetical protein